MRIKAERLMHEKHTEKPEYETVLIVGFTEKSNNRDANPTTTNAIYVNSKGQIFCDRLGYFLVEDESFDDFLKIQPL